MESSDLHSLNPEENLGYLPKPIPVPRDGEIAALLSRTISEHSLAKLQRRMTDGHATVLRAFAERMATAAVRSRDPEQLRTGLVALLLAIGSTDSREGFLLLPLFFDAMLKLGIDPSSFAHSMRHVVGDRLVAPYSEFMSRSDKTLASMGYEEGADNEGFRYVRNW